MLNEQHPLLISACIRCGGLAIGDPDSIPSVWINTETRCPVRPDGTPIEPGEPGTHREPLCDTCVPIMRAAVGRSLPVATLFPLARIDRIDPVSDSHQG